MFVAHETDDSGLCKIAPYCVSAYAKTELDKFDGVGYAFQGSLGRAVPGYGTGIPGYWRLYHPQECANYYSDRF